MFNSGQGRNRKNMGLGAQGTCYCQKCGYETSHQRGTPCYDMKCPNCGAVLTRKELNSVSGSSSMKPVVNQDLCRGCRRCVSACPVDAIKMENGKAVINSSLCIGCRRCVSMCPFNAIS